jgi:protein-S-isoprenylcysteine O-methyltransferase Ste14
MDPGARSPSGGVASRPTAAAADVRGAGQEEDAEAAPRTSRFFHTFFHDPPPRAQRVIRITANLIGAAGAAYFAYVTFQSYLQTHRPIGFLLSAEQMVVVVAYLVRRPARVVTRRFGDWLLAFGGTFVPVLLRPNGAHPEWGLQWGLVLQFCGVAIVLMSFLALGRSFGFAAADRGLVRRGPYRIVRHPIYASYIVLQVGYLFQSFSLRNLAVVILATACNVGRILAEERVLAANPTSAAYRASVRWRMVPGIW